MFSVQVQDNDDDDDELIAVVITAVQDAKSKRHARMSAVTEEEEVLEMITTPFVSAVSESLEGQNAPIRKPKTAKVFSKNNKEQKAYANAHVLNGSYRGGRRGSKIGRSAKEFAAAEFVQIPGR